MIKNILFSKIRDAGNKKGGGNLQNLPFPKTKKIRNDGIIFLKSISKFYNTNVNENIMSFI